jgi:hypothetical protein
VPEVMEVRGKESDFKILTATDNPDLNIGKPYNDKSYTVINNETMLGMVYSAAPDLPLESCGSLQDRSKVFLSFGIDEGDLEIEHRKFDAFLNFGNSFDQSTPFWVNVSNICTVCMNTFGENLRDPNGKIVKVRIRHTKNAMNAIDNMPEIISAALHVQREFGKSFTELMGQKASIDDARNWFTGFVTPEGADEVSKRSQNSIDRLIYLFRNGQGNDGKDWADVFSAITDFYTHESSGGDNKWKQYVSSEFGTAAIKKQAAWNAIINQTNRSEIIRRGKSF